MLGATGAVGQEVLRALLALPQTVQVTTLGRRAVDTPTHERLQQQVVDVHAPASYAPWLQGQQAAICTFGVGQPSKMIQPSMILTPTNRYGLSQALTLALWPKLTVLLGGALRKYRGIAVGTLGAAMARNLLTTSGSRVEILHWPEFMALTTTPR